MNVWYGIDMDECVSLIVPVYNVARELPDCLNSLITQSYRNLQIIIIDDGSSDASPAICDQYVDKDPRIMVVHQENGGVSRARNRGLDMATGSVVGFVDADDWLAPDMVGCLVKLMQETQSDVASCSYLRAAGYMVPSVQNDDVVEISNQEQSIERFLSGNYSASICTKLFRKHVLTQRLQPDMATGEDAWFFYQTLKQMRQLVHTTHPLYFYRTRPDSVTQVKVNLLTMDKLKAADLICQDVADTYPEHLERARFMVFDKYLSVLNQLLQESAEQQFPVEMQAIRQRLNELTGQLSSGRFRRNRKILGYRLYRICKPVYRGVLYLNQIRKAG